MSGKKLCVLIHNVHQALVEWKKRLISRLHYLKKLALHCEQTKWKKL